MSAAIIGGLLTGFVVPAFSLVVPATPAYADDNNAPTTAPTGSAAPGRPLGSAQHQQEFPPPNSVADSDDTARELELQARYGHDRDIATPPLIVKQSTGSGKFVTKPLPIKRHPMIGSVVRKAPPTVTSRPIVVDAGQSVVAGLQPSAFESPATQFMNFAYVAMGVLVLILVTLAVRVSSRKDRLDG